MGNSGIIYKENECIKCRIVDTDGQLKRGYYPTNIGISNQPACRNFAVLLTALKGENRSRISDNTFSDVELKFLKEFIRDHGEDTEIKFVNINKLLELLRDAK